MEPVVSLTNHGIDLLFMPCLCGDFSFLSPSGNKSSGKWAHGRTSWEREVGHDRCSSSHSMTGCMSAIRKFGRAFLQGFWWVGRDMVCE